MTQNPIVGKTKLLYIYDITLENVNQNITLHYRKINSYFEIFIQIIWLNTL